LNQSGKLEKEVLKNLKNEKVISVELVGGEETSFVSTFKYPFTACIGD
jgi:hypothetical protein